MRLTQTLPTDRLGNVYYGPCTSAEAISEIEAAQREARDYEDDSFDLDAEIERVTSMMDGAGYVNAAVHVRNHYR